MEPSVLAYARFHGIASDHLALDPSSLLPPPEAAHPADHFDESDTGNLPGIDYIQSIVIEKQREKLDISNSGAKFLSSVIRSQSLKGNACPEPRWGDFLPDYRRVRRMKVEEPILRSDHELDMCSFRTQTSLDKMELNLPLEQLDDDRDEGLAFPSYFQDLPGDMQERIAKEKLDCTRKVLLFLQGIRDTLGKPTEDAHQGVYDALVYSSKQSIERITPPLLPRDQPPEAFVPPATALELDILSDQEPLALPECDEIERVLAKDSNLDQASNGITVKDCSDRMLLDLPDARPSGSATCISPKRPLRVDVKVDEPITPPVSAKKRCMQEQRTALSDLVTAASMSLWPGPESEDRYLPILDGELAEKALSAKKKIEDRLDTGRLRTADPSVRSAVPHFENFEVLPPWSNSTESPSNSLEAVHSLVTQLKQECNLGFNLEAVVNDERNLPWNPFPEGISRLDVKETIEEHDVLESFIIKQDLNCRSEEKNDMLRPRTLHSAHLFSRGGDDEYVLMSLNFFEGLKTASSEVIQREITSQTKQNTHSTVADMPRDGSEVAIASADCRIIAISAKINPRRSAIFDLQFSAGGQLANFMNVRGHKGKHAPVTEKFSYSKASSPQHEEPQNNENPTVDHEASPQNESSDENHGISMSVLPDIPSPSTSRALVISSSLLRSHRSIVRTLEALSPPAILVFRDNEKEEEDAHITLSPTTGILLTTAQETTQLYLPGHRPKGLGSNHDSPLRGLISRVCMRYEHLYVLICNSTFKGSGKPTMDSKVADSVRSLISFCSSLSSHSQITPLLVPSSTESLTQWIINLSNKHHFTRYPWTEDNSCLETTLLKADDPTTWEHFLRRAGLNSYAAQVVLSLPCPTSDPLNKLDAQDEESRMGRRTWSRPNDALSYFVGMDPDEQIQLFAPVLGERILSRVNKQLDTTW